MSSTSRPFSQVLGWLLLLCLACEQTPDSRPSLLSRSTAALAGDQLVFTTAGQQIGSGGTSAQINVQRQNSSGAALTSGALTVGFSSNSSLGQFSISPDGSSVWTSTLNVNIPAGQSTASVYYRDAKTGNYTFGQTTSSVLTAAAPATTSANQTVILDWFTWQNDLETGALQVTDIPPGGFNGSWYPAAANSITASSAAAHRGSWGMRLVDADSQSGFAGQNTLYFFSPGLSGSYFYRFWSRLTSSSATGVFTFAEIEAYPDPDTDIVGLFVQGSTGALTMTGRDDADTYLNTATGINLTVNRWYLFELQVGGLGTSNGERRLWVDGVERAAAVGLNFTAARASGVTLGEPWSENRIFTGTLDFDDPRTSIVVPGSTLRVEGPTLARPGGCVGYNVKLYSSDDQLAAPPYGVSLTLSATGATASGAFYSDATCTTLLSGPTLTGSGFLFYFKSSGSGALSLQASQLDFLSVPLAVVAANPDRVAFLNQPVNTTPGTVLSPALQVAIEDSNGNVDTTATIAITVTLSGGAAGATLSGTRTVNAVNGIATFADLAVDLEGTGYFLNASAAGLASSSSSAFNVIWPQKLVFTTTAQVLGFGTTSGAITLRRQDSSGAPLTSGTLAVTLTSSSAQGQFSATENPSTLLWNPTGSFTFPAGQSTLTFYYRDGTLGSATLTASASGKGPATQVETIAAEGFADDLESGTLFITDAPKGKWNAQQDLSPLNTVAASTAAVHWKSYGLRYTDGENVSGAGGQDAVQYVFRPNSNDFYFRFSFNVRSSNNLGAAGLVQLLTPNSTSLFDLSLTFPGATYALGGANALGAYTNQVTGRAALTNSWELVEVGLLGLGTPNGTRILWVGGTEYARTTNLDFTGLQVGSIAVGEPFSTDRRFVGSYDFDELASSTYPPASTFALSASGPVTVGSCVPVSIGLRSSGGSVAPAAFDVSALMTVTGLTGSFFSDSNCASATTSLLFPKTASSAMVYFKATSAGTATLQASHIELNNGTTTLAVQSATGKLVFTSAPKTLGAGVQSSAITLQRQDGAGAALTVGTVSVNLSASSALGRFSATSAPEAVGTPTLTVSIPNGQSSVSFYFRDGQGGSSSLTATATGLTAMSQAFTATPDILADGFEGGTLLYTDAPAGAWSKATATSAQVTRSISAAAAHRGSVGLRFVDNASAPGSGVENWVSQGVTPLTQYYLRTWMRLASSNSLGDILPLRVTGTAASASSMAEVGISYPSGVLYLGGSDQGGTYAQVGTGQPPGGGWVLIEIGILGAGSASGTRTLWVNGTKLAQTTGINWTGDDVQVAALGEPYAANLAFTGTLDFDDVRASTQPLASKVVANASGNVSAGSCVPVTVGLEDSEGAIAPVPYPLTATLGSTGVAGNFYSDSGCVTAVTGVNFIAGSTTAQTVYFRSNSSGSALLSAVHPDFLSPQASVTFSAGPPASMAFTVQPGSTTAGAVLGGAGGLQVTLLDAFGNIAVSSSATLTLAIASGPAGAALGGSPMAIASAGVANFPSVWIGTAGTFTLTVSGPVAAAASSPFQIIGGSATRLVVNGLPSTLAAGSSSPATVTARDSFGNVVSNYTGIVAFSSTDALATLPGSYTFTGPDNGTHSFPITFATLGRQTLTATDSLGNTGSQTVSVTQPAAKLRLSGLPGTLAAGATYPVTVTALDVNDVVATAYTGQVVFRSSDLQAQLPPGFTFAAADQGAKSFTLSLRTAGTQWVEVADLAGNLVYRQTPLTVTPGPATALSVSGIPSPIEANVPADVRIDARDAFGNVATGYLGTVTFSSSDTQAVLPSALGFSAANAGTQQLTAALRLRTPGMQSVTALDGANSLSGTQGQIQVDPPRAPLVVQDANLKAAVGLPYAYNAVRSVQALGTRPLQYAACGGPPGFIVNPGSGAVQWTPSTTGTVSLCVSASNSFGNDSFTFSVQVVNRAATPVTAALVATPGSGSAPLQVSFDSAGSSGAPDALPLMMRWDFGDGSPPTSGVTAQHLYPVTGTRNARVRVTDAYGAQAEAFTPVSVLGPSGLRPPLARIVASAVSGADTLPVDFSCACQPGSSPLSSYRWDLSPGDTASTATLTRTFTPGRYHVRLTVTDSAGLTATDSVEVVVTRGAEVPPTCEAFVDPPAGAAPLNVRFSGLYQVAVGQAVASRYWEFSATDRVEATEVLRAYTAPQNIDAALTVEDGAGLRCSDRAEVQVLSSRGGVSPKIVTDGARQGECGKPYQYATSGALATGGNVSWSLGEAPAGSSVDPSSGEILWIPTRGQTGPRTLVLVAENEAGRTEQQLSIEVSCGDDVPLKVGCGCSTRSDFPGALGLLLLTALGVARRRKVVAGALRGPEGLPGE